MTYYIIILGAVLSFYLSITSKCQFINFYQNLFLWNYGYSFYRVEGGAGARSRNFRFFLRGGVITDGSLILLKSRCEEQQTCNGYILDFIMSCSCCMKWKKPFPYC